MIGTVNQPPVGDLASLTTTVKTSAVAAINEVDGNADAAAALVGNLATLQTVYKSSAVTAINEVWYSVRRLMTGAYTCDGDVVWSPLNKTLTFGGLTRVWHGYSYTTNFYDLVLDFSSITQYGYAYVDGVDPDIGGTIDPADVHYAEYTSAPSSNSSVIVLAFYNNANRTIYTPFTYTSTSSAAIDAWVNLYPQVMEKLAPFMAKLTYMSDDVTIVAWGDSLFGRPDTASAVADATILPPTITHKNILWWLWNQLPGNKAQYRRYDYTGGYFTFTGSWTASYDDANWDDAYPVRVGWTKFSVSTNAAFAWTLGTSDDESGCNLIYRTDTAGDAAATITVTEGTGYLEYWNGSSWVEAHGATVSMLEVDEGSYNANTIYQKRLKLRKAAAQANESVTITIGKASADADRLLMWGVELYDAKNGKHIVQLVNSGRGGNSLQALRNRIDDDVHSFDPDLVILEIPLINMVAEDQSNATIYNAVQDVIWGDRVGAEETHALLQNAEISNSGTWDNFQVLLVIPNHPQVHFNADGSWAETSADLTARDQYGAAKTVIYTKKDVAMIDLSAAFLRELDKTYDNYYDGMASSLLSDDTVHPNDAGSEVWARHMCPIFDAGTL